MPRGVVSVFSWVVCSAGALPIWCRAPQGIYPRYGVHQIFLRGNASMKLPGVML